MDQELYANQLDPIVLDNSGKVTILSNSEIHFILKKFETNRTEKFKNKPLHPVTLKFQEYIDQFANYKEGQTIDILREKLINFCELKHYQIMMLWNLNPNSVEEAKSLVRDLEDVDDETIKQILILLEKYRKNDQC